MDIAYLQADLRYNGWLLESIGNKKIIEITIEKICELNCQKIVAGIYICEENKSLIEVIRDKNIQIILTKDEDVNLRFMNVISEEKADYVIRIGGDQVMLDVEAANRILAEMKEYNKDFFYDTDISSILPDIVSVKCLKKYRTEILKERRYFTALEKVNTINRYMIPKWSLLLFDFRVNSSEGYRICKNIIEKDMNVYDVSKRLGRTLKNKENYLNRTGIWESWILGNSYEDFFRDNTGKVNPWWGRSVIDLIKSSLKREYRVFEWGAGNSTLFWSQYVGEVISIESDKEWYEKLIKILPKTVKLMYCELQYNGDYCRKILDEEGKFDIILIDGRDRVRCAKSAVNCIKSKGIIIWDNTDRKYYEEGYVYLEKCGYKKLEISSIIYGLPGQEDYTSIFYRENNILGL